MSFDPFKEALLSSLGSFPLLVVWIIGLIISMKHKAKNPPASKKMTIAFSIMICTFALNIASLAWLSSISQSIGDLSRSSFHQQVSILGGIQALLNLVAWILFLVGLHQAFKNSYYEPAPNP